MATSFISYRRGDSAGYAGRLCESLEHRLGKDAVFRDVEAIEPGEDFVQAISARLRDCRVLIAVIGREWLDARDAAGRRRLDQPHDYVRLEIAAALQRPDVLVVPALVDGAQMPDPDALPADIRALSRRNAVTLRDETWDEDVDRLAEVIRKAAPARTARTRNKSYGWAAAAAITIVAIAAMVLTRERPHDAAVDRSPAERTSGPGDGSAGGRTAAPAHAIATPPSAEVAHGDLVYTLLSGNIVRSGDTNTLRLRIRFANDSSVAANFWDDSFRLVAGDAVLSPTSHLNEVVEGQSVRLGIVTFDVPASVPKVVFRIRQRDAYGDIPLDVSRASGAPADERADAGDALSRAIIRPVLDGPRPLIAAGDLTMTLAKVTARRFVNTVQLRVAARLSNAGRYPVHSGAVVLRLIAGGETKAPTHSPNEALDGGTSKPLDYVFEIDPAAKQASLRASIGSATATIALDVP